MSASTIPVIDLAAVAEPGGRKKIAEAFRSAYESCGFGAIVNHGVPPDVLSGLFEASRRFHAQTIDEKLTVELNDSHRGYIPINTSTDVNSSLAEVRRPNQSESFMVMREDAATALPVLQNAYLSGANQWPSLAGFRDAVTEGNRALSVLGSTLIEVACIAMSVDSKRLLPHFECPTTWLRMLHYPPQPPHSPDDLFGSAPHTDFGCLTILAQDGIGGLQVLDQTGSAEDNWIDVEPAAETLIVNVGDMLHRWSNGILRSTPHRVINRSGQERYSCAFFFDPYVNTVVEPLAECITVGNSARFEPVHFGQFLRMELEAAYEHHRGS